MGSARRARSITPPPSTIAPSYMTTDWPGEIGRRVMANLHLELSTDGGCVHHPVDLARDDPAPEQLLARPDHDLARCRPNLDDEHRLAEAARKSATLPHRESCEPVMRAEHGAIATHEVTAR
jgi:hypothetical protein